jgi:hypothetical protein
MVITKVEVEAASVSTCSVFYDSCLAPSEASAPQSAI